MGDICVFCGRERKGFSKEVLHLGQTQQPICESCMDHMEDMSLLECARLALDSGRAQQRAELQEFVEQEEAKLQEERKSILTGKTCLRCGGQMIAYGRRQFQLSRSTELDRLLFPSLAAGLTDDLGMVIMCCEECGKAEFYLPTGAKKTLNASAPAAKEEDTAAPQIKKPVWPAPKRKGPKPPWEK